MHSSNEDFFASQNNSLNLQLLQRAVHASNNGIIITNCSLPDEPIVYCNPAFEQLTGYLQAEILGKNCRFLQGPETDRKATALIRAAIKEGHSCRMILKNYRKDRSEFWNELTIAPVKDETGRVTHYIGVQNDMTALIEAQNELQGIHRDQAQKVAQHVEELTESNRFLQRINELLREEQRYAASLLEMVGQPFIVLDGKFRVVSANRCFRETFKINLSELENMPLEAIGNGDWNILALKEKLLGLSDNGSFANLEIVQRFSQVGEKVLLVNAKQVLMPENNLQRILISIEDVTEKRLLKQLK